MKRKIVLELEAPSDFGMKFLTDSVITVALALCKVKKSYRCGIAKIDPPLGTWKCDA